MGLELKVEESNFGHLKRIDPGYDSIEFTNRMGGEVDSIELAEYLVNVEGISQVQKLIIDFSSQLNDLKIVRAFPNLRSIAVYGYKIASLDGLEWFQQGEYIKISTESQNRRRGIAQISEAPIKRMSLQLARPEDLDAISECLTLNSLELFRSMELDFSKWIRVPLETLNLKQGKFKELRDMSKVGSLRNLMVLGCRNLEQFSGDNSQIVWMLVDGSKKLDLRSVQTFQGLEGLTVNGNSCEIPISEIGELRQLKGLNLIDCKVHLDTINLKHQFPSLKELHISQMKEEQVLELSQHNPNVLVTGKIFMVKNVGLKSYKALNGSLVE